MLQAGKREADKRVGTNNPMARRPRPVDKQQFGRIKTVPPPHQQSPSEKWWLQLRMEDTDLL